MNVDRFLGRFSATPPPFVSSPPSGGITLEMKPYLQPFERTLALRELRALLRPGDSVSEEHGYWIVHTDVPVGRLRERLAFWQRLGHGTLEPTLQTALELTQVGSARLAEQGQLHRTRRLRYGPHNVHEYRGKFFPQLVRGLSNISGIPDGGLVLDPMCGSGTCVLESMAGGYSAVGMDLNPLSVLITKAKALALSFAPEEFADKAHHLLSRLEFLPTRPEALWNEGDTAYLSRWFGAGTISEIASIRASIERVPEEGYRTLFRVCLSNIVRAVSWQNPEDLRIRKRFKEHAAGTARELFTAQVVSQVDRIQPYLGVLGHRAKVKPDVRVGNAIDLPTVFPRLRNRVDLLVTSPPYATALPYIDTDRLSLIILGLLSRDKHGDVESKMIGTREITDTERKRAWELYARRKRELPARVVSLIDRVARSNHTGTVGFRRRNLPSLLGKYYLAMLDAMTSARTLMRPGAPAFFIVGNNSTTVDGEKLTIPTDSFVFEIGERAGFRPTERIPMELLTSRDIFRKNRGSAETILCFTA